MMLESLVKMNEAFSKVGEDYGYTSVTVVFAETVEYKVRWRRGCKTEGRWIEFEMTDYLADAPVNVMEAQARMIFAVIAGDKKEYPKELLAWLTSEEFVKTKRPVYLGRTRNLTGSPEGTHINLEDSYQRLIDAGLVERDDNILISWTKNPNRKKVGWCSILMKVIYVSSILDDPNIPSYVADYVLYHELLHTRIGFDPFGHKHDLNFLALEHLHPMHEEAEEWLKRLRLDLEGDAQ